MRSHPNSAVTQLTIYTRGFPGGSEVKASACNAGDLGSIPGLGRSPAEGNGNPLQYSCLENPMDGGAWWTIDKTIYTLHILYMYNFLIAYKHIMCTCALAPVCVCVNVCVYIHLSFSVQSSQVLLCKKNVCFEKIQHLFL